MKKLLFILSLFFSTAGFAQTKEETISWLKEKLMTYLKAEETMQNGKEVTVSKIDLISINECQIVLQMTVNYPGGNISHTKVILPTAISEISEERGYFKCTAEVISYDRQVEEKGKIVLSETSYYDSTYTIIIRKGEENIRKRIENALKHLATFCPKKKEAF